MERAQVGKTLSLSVSKPRARLLDFTICLGELYRQFGALKGAVAHPWQRPTWSDLAIFAESGMDLDGRRIGPRRGRRQIRHTLVRQEVTRRIESKCCTSEAVRLGGVPTVREPARERSEISGAVAAALYRERKLLFPKNDAGFCQIVRRQLNRNLVSGDNADEMFAHFTGDMCKHVALAGKINAEHRAGQDLRDGAFGHNRSFLRHCRRIYSASARATRLTHLIYRNGWQIFWKLLSLPPRAGLAPFA